MSPERAERFLKVFLRITALCIAPFAAGAVFMPREWMDAVHQRIGMGPLPQGVIVEHMARMLSAMYALTGAVIWVLASDVRRHAAVLRALFAVWTLLAAALVPMGMRAGMPLWWPVGDAASLALPAAIVFALLRRVEAAPGVPGRSSGECLRP